MNNNVQSPASPEFVATLPFRSQQITDPDANLDVSVWCSSQNLCECRGETPCDTVGSLYYGSVEDDVAKFCPRHFYEMHLGANAPYQLTSGHEVRRPES